MLTEFSIAFEYLPPSRREFKKPISCWAISSVKLWKRVFSMRAVIPDRDGVVIRKAQDGEYIRHWREVELLHRPPRPL